MIRRLKLEVRDSSLFEAILLTGKHKEAFVKIIETLKGRKDLMRFKEIAEQVKIDNRIISTVLKLMEKARMVERIQRSKKLVYYRLSDKFIKILQNWIKEWEETIK